MNGLVCWWNWCGSYVENLAWWHFFLSTAFYCLFLLTADLSSILDYYNLIIIKLDSIQRPKLLDMFMVNCFPPFDWGSVTILKVATGQCPVKLNSWDFLSTRLWLPLSLTNYSQHNLNAIIITLLQMHKKLFKANYGHENIYFVR